MSLPPSEQGRGEQRAVRARDLGPDSGPVELPVSGLVDVLLRHRRHALVPPVIAVAAVLALTLMQARFYTSTASFMPQTRSAPAALSGLAAQLGVALPAAEATRSPAFYADLLRTRQLLTRVVDARSSDAMLIERLARSGRTPALRREDAVRRLRNLMTVDLVQRTGVIRVAVRAPGPVLARDIVVRLIDELNTFNLDVRRSQASAERQFTEQRVAQIRQELRDAEDRLQTFLQRNREFASSPQLRFEQDRLAREVAMRQQLYTSLSQAHEQAKIDEIRDTPVIVVVEGPEAPVKPDSRGLLRKGFLALLGGLVLGTALAFAKEHLAGPAASRG